MCWDERSPLYRRAAVLSLSDEDKENRWGTAAFSALRDMLPELERSMPHLRGRIVTSFWRSNMMWGNIPLHIQKGLNPLAQKLWAGYSKTHRNLKNGRYRPLHRYRLPKSKSRNSKRSTQKLRILTSISNAFWITRILHGGKLGRHNQKRIFQAVASI